VAGDVIVGDIEVIDASTRRRPSLSPTQSQVSAPSARTLRANHLAQLSRAAWYKIKEESVEQTAAGSRHRQSGAGFKR